MYILGPLLPQRSVWDGLSLRYEITYALRALKFLSKPSSAAMVVNGSHKARLV